MSPAELGRNPRVTIGVPAYRNAATIRATLESIAAQSYGDFRVVVSDDVSPDNTAEICRAFAAADSRITFVQQPENLNYGNFRYLVNAADTEYFMWLAGDDSIGPDFVRENLRILEARPDVVLSVSRCLFLKDGVELRYSDGTYALMGSPEENILRFIYRPGDNTRMYGIFRTEVLRQAFPTKDFYGYDYSVSIKSLIHGTHYEIPEVMLYRDYTPRQNYARLMFRDGRGVADRLFPGYGIMRDVWSAPGFPRTRNTWIALASMNLYHHYTLSRAYHPRYAKLLPPVLGFWERRIGWRANPWRAEEIAEAEAQSRLDSRTLREPHE